MAKKSGLIQRQRASEDAMYAAGNRVGLQKMTDFFIIALSVFAAIRIIRKAERKMNAKKIALAEAEAALLALLD